MSPVAEVLHAIPRELASYPQIPGESLLSELARRVDLEPFNAVATTVFFLAILHTFAAARFTRLAHRLQHWHDKQSIELGRAKRPSARAEILHFLGEVEVVFGLWAVVLIVAAAGFVGWESMVHYVNGTVNYTEPLFVVVIMAIASTRPVVGFAEAALRRLAAFGGSTPAAWWLAILTVGPVLGSFITEPGAMTICALLLARQFFDLQPSTALKYATLGLLFVNVSIGGTFTDFAAPPVLMVERAWGWDIRFMLVNFGWRALAAIVVSAGAYFLLFLKEFRQLSQRAQARQAESPDEDEPGRGLLPVPAWVVTVHLLFMAWTVYTSHYPALFVGGFLFFLGFTRATSPYQGPFELKTPLLVGFFLGGLVIHGGLQGWWIGPVLRRLSETPLFFAASFLTAFNDNALITYLATLVPDLDPAMKLAVVQGAVVGGGLTVIANAPNPAGQALLGRFFGGAVSPLWLAIGALLPTLSAAAAFRLL